MTRRNIFLLVVSLLVTGIKCQESDCTFADNCNAEDGSIAHYKCDPDDGTRVFPICECTGDSCTDPVTETAENIETNCKTLCTSEESSACKFFKYTQDADILGGAKHCYLMGSNQCDAHAGNPCRPGHCISEGIGCDGTDNPTIAPGTNKCPLIEEFKYDKSGNSLHWLCMKFPDGDNVDIYADGTEVDTGTVCTASHSCYLYPYPPPVTQGELPDGANYELRFKCQDNENGDGGEWKSDRTIGDEADTLGNAILNGGKLVEPNCSPDPMPLVLDKYPTQKDQGMMVTCSDSAINPDNGEVTAPNECILLCDYYPILRFNPDWVENSVKGEKSWIYTSLVDTDVDAGADGVVDPTKIRCYDE